MKYLLTLLIIIVSITAVTFFYLRPEPKTVDKDILVVVNGHSLPRSLLEQKNYRSGHLGKDDKEIVDSIIINELLLQEAQRLNIDKEPNFRLSIQNYYEQSLIKTLIDRQFSDLKIMVTDQEIDRYISNYGKIFTYTRFSEKKLDDSLKKQQQRSVHFAELSDFLKMMLGDLKEGERINDFSDSNEVISYRLDKIEQVPVQEPYMEKRESIRKIITNYKQERAVTAWIIGLRDQATIIYPK